MRDDSTLMSDRVSAVESLSNRLGVPWDNLASARNLSAQTLLQLQSALGELDTEEASIVLLGSLGRAEFTRGSDIDWNLLVDGIANPNHHQLFIEAKAEIDSLAPKSVGREGAFGSFVSSHDLIHKIGGEDDTNSNTTRRLLLLLESVPLGNSVTHSRVVKNILKRYLLEDRSFWRGTTAHKHHVPHFLLNDLARFWRTMAVDFAYKLRARSGKGWAIRNIKLRISRKLLYVAGLLASYQFQLGLEPEQRDRLFGETARQSEVLEFGHNIFSQTPLDIVAQFLTARPALHDPARRLFATYDQFLGILSDPDCRRRLEEIGYDEAEHDSVYVLARSVSHAFRDAVLDIFFDRDQETGTLTRMYGVF